MIAKYRGWWTAAERWTSATELSSSRGRMLVAA